MKYTQYTTLPESYVRSRILQFLQEDMPRGDVTTQGTMGQKQESGEARIIAVEKQVFVGEYIIPWCFEDDVTIHLEVSDGDELMEDTVIARLQGPYSSMLSRERVMLNLLQRLTGIATLTRKYTAIAEPYGVKILDTRKTTPGLRLFEKYAVAAAGGSNHRLDLSSGILIKDNHILAAGGVAEAIVGCRAVDKNLPVELEVDTLDQIDEGLTAGVDGFLLDNMTPAKTIQGVQKIRKSPRGGSIFIESSGGITLETLAGYMNTGIDAVSIGALTHSAGSCDIRLDFEGSLQ